MTDTFEGKEEVAGLLDQVGQRGRLQLPSLTREELAALGQLDAGPLRDAGEVAWWSRLDEGTRAAAAGTALHGLVARGLLRLVGPEPRLLPSPELAVLMAARTRPSFIAIGAEPQRLQPLRLYGIVDRVGAPRCLLLETAREDAVHDFELCTAAKAAEHLADWASAPLADGARAVRMRTLEVLRLDPSAPIRWRLVVARGGDDAAFAEVDDQSRVGAPRVVVGTRLRETLEEFLKEAASEREGDN
jgi:hypothetical protein